MPPARVRPDAPSVRRTRVVSILLVAAPSAGSPWVASVRQRLRREGAQVLPLTVRSVARAAELAADQRPSAIVVADPGTDSPRRHRAIERSLRDRGACGIPVFIYAGRTRRRSHPSPDTAPHLSVPGILRRLRAAPRPTPPESAEDDSAGGERPCQLRIDD